MYTATLYPGALPLNFVGSTTINTKTQANTKLNILLENTVVQQQVEKPLLVPEKREMFIFCDAILVDIGYGNRN